jgi:hypothetical protein
VPKKKAFLLRIDQKIYLELERWAVDELRSVNAQMEYLLRRALQQEGRVRKPR